MYTLGADPAKEYSCCLGYVYVDRMKEVRASGDRDEEVVGV